MVVLSKPQFQSGLQIEVIIMHESFNTVDVKWDFILKDGGTTLQYEIRKKFPSKIVLKETRYILCQKLSLTCIQLIHLLY